MADETENNRQPSGQRDAKGRFVKGSTGNPNGARRKEPKIRDLCLAKMPEVIDTVTKVAQGQAIIVTVYDEATKETKRVGIAIPKVSDIMRANELMIQYVYGKPKQVVSLGENPEEPFEAHAIGARQMLARIRAIHKKAKQQEERQEPHDERGTGQEDRGD